MLTAADVIATLGLQPLPLEGGYFRQTYCSSAQLPNGAPLATAIYFLLTPDSSSRLHCLQEDELWHAYAGDPVEHVCLDPHSGDGWRTLLHHGLTRGTVPQLTVPAGVWQGARLAADGAWALLGCTLSPGWSSTSFTLGDVALLTARFPEWSHFIAALSRAEG